MTGDVDIAIPLRLPTGGESLADRLERHGFEPAFLGNDSPPVTHYQLGHDDDAFYVEFLAPLVGSGLRRDGSPGATAGIAGVTAQKLRHIDVLLNEPWTVRLTEQGGFPVGRGALDVRIANPVSYLVQKILVLQDRKPGDQAKDLLYIHDTVLILGDGLDELSSLWTRVAATLHVNVRKRVHARRAELFAAVTDRTRSAALIATSTGRADAPSAERLVATCRAGLARIFG